jgi:hypothetical protein
MNYTVRPLPHGAVAQGSKVLQVGLVWQSNWQWLNLPRLALQEITMP